VTREQRGRREPKTRHRYARASFLSRGVISAALPAQGADNNTAYSGAVPACGLCDVFGATEDHAAGRRVGQAKMGLTASHSGEVLILRELRQSHRSASIGNSDFARNELSRLTAVYVAVTSRSERFGESRAQPVAREDSPRGSLWPIDDKASRYHATATADQRHRPLV
jgi:hypothetical protein